MAIAFEDASRASHTSPGKAHSRGANASSAHRVNLREGLDRLTKLLTAAPIDLTSISDEIRRHRELEALILRLVVSLDLCADEPVASVEEAIVALGAGRVRLLVELWASTGNLSQGESPAEPIAHTSAAAQAPTTPEARYLTEFLRRLDSDSSLHGLAGAHVALWASRKPHEPVDRFTDVFMRDLFSLLPVICPHDRKTEAAARKHPSR